MNSFETILVIGGIITPIYGDVFGADCCVLVSASTAFVVVIIIRKPLAKLVSDFALVDRLWI